jgi:hypothetical protein
VRHDATGTQLEPPERVERLSTALCRRAGIEEQLSPDPGLCTRLVRVAEHNDVCIGEPPMKTRGASGPRTWVVHDRNVDTVEHNTTRLG